jgi:hypothetical protein
MNARTALRTTGPFLLCLALAAPAAAQVQQRAPTATKAQTAAKSSDKTFSGCLQSISHEIDADGRVGVLIGFAGAPGPVALQPQGGMTFTGNAAKMTLAQLRDWAPILDALRDAAQSKKMVGVRIDFNTNKVELVNIAYNVGC